MPSIPLFPLGGTLLPGTRLLLQVFEDRYVALLRHLIDSEGVELGFGVLAIRQGYEVGDRTNELYAVGCLAVLDRVVQLKPGFFVVIGHGTRRFRMDAVDESSGTPWMTAEVTWLEDPPGDESQIPVLAGAVRELVHFHGVTIGYEAAYPPDDPALLPYWAAQSLGLGPDERQRLLEVSETSARLSLVRRMAQREASLAASLGLSGGAGGSRLSLN